MKATELQIGDWVQINEYDEYTQAPYNKPYPVQILNGSDIDRAYEVTFDPIPLTAEILEKNAFSLDDDGWYVWNDYTHNPTQHFVSVSFHRGGSVRHIEIKSARCHANYENVHHINEFQQALRLCGFNALADNFKIK